MASSDIEMCSWVLKAPDTYVLSACAGALVVTYITLGIAAGILYAAPKRHQKVLGLILGIILALLPASTPVQGKLLELNESQRFLVMFVFAGGLGIPGFCKATSVAFNWFPAAGENFDLRTWFLWFLYTPEPRIGHDGKVVNATSVELCDRILCLTAKVIAGTFLMAFLQPPHLYEGNLEFDCSRSYSSGSGGASTGTYAIIRDDLKVNLLQSLDTSLKAEIGLSADTLFGRLRHAGFEYCRTCAWVWALYLFLGTSIDLGSLPLMLLHGVSPMPGFRNPLLASHSLRDLWGHRWNQPINQLLKRGVYKPVAFGIKLGSEMGTVATFLASGLLHEYIYWMHFHVAPGQSAPSFYSPGSSTAFFIFMGTAMAVENTFIASRKVSAEDEASDASKALLCTKSSQGENEMRTGESSTAPPNVTNLPTHRTAVEFLNAVPCIAWLFDRQQLNQRLIAPLVVAVHLVLWGPLFKGLFLKPWVDSGMFGAIALLFPQLECVPT